MRHRTSTRTSTSTSKPLQNSCFAGSRILTLLVSSRFLAFSREKTVNFETRSRSQKLEMRFYLFERSEFLIDTSPKKNPSVCVCVRLILVLVGKTLILVLVWGTYYMPATYVPGISRQTTVWYQVRTYNIGLHPPPQKNTWYQRALRCQLRGRPFHPWAGRLRFSGEAHPGPVTLTQSSSFSCGAGLHSESRLLLCCAPSVYMLLMLL